MICSRCSAPIKPVVALDIDGTLGDYHGHFLDFALRYIGTEDFAWRESYDGADNWGDWVCQTLAIDRATYRDVKLAYRQGGQKRMMPAYAGAVSLSDAARAAGAELWITTSRPYLRLDNIDPDTRFWLDRHGIVYDHAVYDANKYAVLAERVDPERVCAVLDDLGVQYDAAAVEFGSPVPILRKTSWNIAVRRRLMADDLDVARIMITAHIADWKIRHSFDKLPTTQEVT